MKQALNVKNTGHKIAEYYQVKPILINCDIESTRQ